jgi:Heterokaryon incompatibility protein (HET)
MSQYCYSSLSLGHDSIRLLRLMPHENEKADIECELFEYSLQDSDKRNHLYEALSYAWGGSDKPLFISIKEHKLPVTANLHKEHKLPVTANLHTALSRLRDRSLTRIIWVDAVCIDQENPKERGDQVQLMAKIYSEANRVIVWLGEMADNSNDALEGIRVAAQQESTNSLNDKTLQRAILALLQRPWFRRIWVSEQTLDTRRGNY